jgi:hypothetical protein
MEFFSWVEGLPVSQAILTSIWLHPWLLAGHSVGMGIVVGIIFMLDLRILGYLRGIPLEIFSRLVALGWVGFALNFVTGLLMLMAYAHTLATNWTFQLKMVCIVLGGITIWLLAPALASDGAAGAEAVPGPRARLLAMASLLFWIGAIAMGRLIAYTAPEGV